MQIVIPTHGRVNKQITLKAIPASLREDVLLVTSTKEDAEAIKKFHKNVVASGSKSIAEKRQWIMMNVKPKDNKLIMLDDDMTFQSRSPSAMREFRDGGWKPKGTTEGVLTLKWATDSKVKSAFEAISDCLDDYAHAGLSSRLGNDRVETEWAYTTRMMHAIAYRTDIFKKEKLDFSEVKFREDFNVTLHLLRRGYDNAVLYNTCVSPGAYGAAGGVSLERTVEASNKEAELLADIHPGYVKLKQKDYKGTPRIETVISWKKAYADAE